MNKNSKFVVAVTTQEKYDLLMNWADTNNIKNTLRYDTSIFKYHKENTGVNIINNQIDGYSDVPWFETVVSKYGPIISFEHFAAMQGIALGPDNKEILIGDYTSTINYSKSTVTVGCQVIPFTTVDEVYKLIHAHD